MYQKNRRPSPRVDVFSAMCDVGTYRQVRPLCQSAGGYVHKERMQQNNNRPHTRDGCVFRDVCVFRAGDDFRDA